MGGLDILHEKYLRVESMKSVWIFLVLIIPVCCSSLYDKSRKHNIQRCSDLRKDCGYLRGLGWCTFYSKRMVKVCPQTCRLCAKNKPLKQERLTTPPRKGKVITNNGKIDQKVLEARLVYCRDRMKNVQCQYYKHNGLCQRGNMKIYCRKTCVCDRKSSGPNCSSAKYGCCHDKKTTKRSPIGLGCPACKDDHRYHRLCRRFKSDCNGQGRFAKSLRKHCFKTCKIC